MALRSSTRRFTRLVSGLSCRTVHTSPASRDLKQSHVTGASNVPVLDITYDQLLRDQISAYPHKDLHRAPHENAKLTVSEFKNNADGIAKGFKDVIGTNQSFATAIGLRTEAFIAQFGAPRSNNTFVALQPGRTSRIVDELKSVNPRALLWAPRLGDSIQLDEIYSVFPYLNNAGRFETAPLNDPRFPNLHHLFHNAKKNLPGMSWVKPLIAVERIPDTLAGLPSDPRRDASVLVTPNMLHLALSQYNILNTANAVGALCGIEEADITLTTLPLHHAAGQSLGLAMALTRRSQLAIASDVFDAQLVLDSLNREKCSVLVAQPHEWDALASLPTFTQAAPSNLKKGIVVTSPSRPVTNSFMASLKTTFGLDTVISIVGIDETSGAFLANGKPLPNTELKVVDNSGKILPTGSKGQLLVRGPNVMNGYRNSADATQKALDSDRWLRTGVQAVVQPDGTVVLN